MPVGFCICPSACRSMLSFLFNTWLMLFTFPYLVTSISIYQSACCSFPVLALPSFYFYLFCPSDPTLKALFDIPRPRLINLQTLQMLMSVAVFVILCFTAMEPMKIVPKCAKHPTPACYNHNKLFESPWASIIRIHGVILTHYAVYAVYASACRGGSKKKHVPVSDQRCPSPHRRRQRPQCI